MHAFKVDPRHFVSVTYNLTVKTVNCNNPDKRLKIKIRNDKCCKPFSVLARLFEVRKADVLALASASY